MKIAIHNGTSWNEKWMSYCINQNIPFLSVNCYDSDIIKQLKENEWASATETTAGANGMDLIDDVKTIQEAKQQSDIVFVIVHGGHEYYNLPSPRMQKQYRFYIDNGADLVVGHHTHCISGMETYKNKPIYYSLGNFLFTNPSQYEDWYKGIVLEVKINVKKEIKTKPIFVNQAKENFKLSLIDNNEFRLIQKKFDAYSYTITNYEDLLINWNRYLELKKSQYKNWWSALAFIKFRLLKAAFIKTNTIPFNKHGAKLFLNLMRCESHYDLSKSIINKLLTK